MDTRKIILKCHHSDCAGDVPLEVVVAVPEGDAGTGETKEKLVYCARNHANIITVPAAWDSRPPVLGDPGVADIVDGTPILRGRQP